MSVKLLAHTQLTAASADMMGLMGTGGWHVTDGQAIALTAIRTCYSPTPSADIVADEGERYFGASASDGAGGTEADRLCRRIVSSGHTSTLEHLTYTFAVSGVSRALLAQLTRHRHASFSVQSQRYVRLGSADKSGGFDYATPVRVLEGTGSYQVVRKSGEVDVLTPKEYFCEVMDYLQGAYDVLRDMGIPPEDARAVLPNATSTSLVLTVNLRALLEFYSKRRAGSGAQGEIVALAERLRSAVVEVEPWTDVFFEGV